MMRPRLPRCGDFLDYQLKLLRSCPEVEHVEIAVSTGTQLEAIRNALSATRGIKRLYVVLFDPSENRYGHEEEEDDLAPTAGSDSDVQGVALAHELLRSPTFSKVTELELSLRFITLKKVLPGSNILSLTKFSIYAGRQRITKVLQFFPVDFKILRDFKIELKMPCSSDIPKILSRLDNRIERIAIIDACKTYNQTSIDDYRKPPHRRFEANLRVPISDLQRFPQLVELQLSGFQGPSVTLLRTLSQSSPLLKALDFSDSYWVPDSAVPFDAADEVYFRLAFKEEEVAHALEELKFLQDVDLGYLPFVKEDSAEEVEEDFIPIIRGLVGRKLLGLCWTRCREKYERGRGVLY